MPQVSNLEVWGSVEPILNVTTAVGPQWGAEGDVMLVKMFLELILPDWGHPPSILSNPRNGTLDDATKKNIKTYQSGFNSQASGQGSPLRLSVDGRVSIGRAHLWSTNSPFTIVTMNQVANLIVRRSYYKGVTEWVTWNYPQLGELMGLKWYPSNF